MNASFVPSNAMTPVTHTLSLIRLASLTALLSLSAVQASAELADKDKPMNIEADALSYNDAQQTSVFKGRVLITKGTILMRGDTLNVRQDPEGNQFGVLTGNASKLGFFRQKREGVDEYIEGEGEKVVYDSKKQTVVLTGQAVLRRYRGSQLNDESAGNEITYSSETEVFTVKGGKGGTTATNPSGRVRAMLTPIPQEGTAPAAPVENPATLRPSNQIKENPQ